MTNTKKETKPAREWSQQDWYFNKEHQSEVQRRFNQDFNFIHMDLLNAAYGEETIMEAIRRKPEPDIENFEEEAPEEFDEEGENTEAYEEWEARRDKWYEQAYSEWEEDEWYPMWSTVFEARDNMLSDKIMEHVKELAKIGIGVIEPLENTNACLFICGCGYAFYPQHWEPMYSQVFKWVKRPVPGEIKDFPVSFKITVEDFQRTMRRKPKTQEEFDTWAQSALDYMIQQDEVAFAEARCRFKNRTK